MQRNKQLAAAAIVLVAITWWLATDPSSPIRPEPPKPDRPVVRFLVKVARVAAKIGLTAMFFCEPAPHADEMQLVRTTYGADGYQQLENARW